MSERGQVVALADGEVVGVVRGRDLDGAGAELGLGPVVGEDGDLAVGLPAAALSGRVTSLPMKCLVALVVRIDGDGDVAEHGLGAGGGDDDGAGAVGEGVADVVELAEAVFVGRLRGRRRRSGSAGPS